MKHLRSITAVLATTALAAGVAAPAFAQTSTATDSSTATQPGGHHGRHGGRKLTDAQLTVVATKLGVTLDALKAAQASVKTATDATAVKETRTQKDALLATALGVSPDALRAAFASVHGTTDGTCKKGSGSTSGTTAGNYPTDTSTAAAA